MDWPKRSFGIFHKILEKSESTFWPTQYIPEPKVYGRKYSNGGSDHTKAKYCNSKQEINMVCCFIVPKMTINKNTEIMQVRANLFPSQFV